MALIGGGEVIQQQIECARPEQRRCFDPLHADDLVEELLLRVFDHARTCQDCRFLLQVHSESLNRRSSGRTVSTRQASIRERAHP